MPEININTDACIELVNKLEQLNRSAMPVAVRQTLNDAAFDVKNNTLQASANQKFIRRSPNFFKTFSAVNRAGGFNINSMRAEVGMTDQGKVTARAAIAHMPQQEQGGAIKGGGDYLKGSRTGSLKRRVNTSKYFAAQMNNLVTGPGRNRSAKSAFVASAYVALMQGKALFINTLKGRFLISVTAISAFVKTKQIKVTTQVLMMDRKEVQITGTHFSEDAAEMTLKKVPDFFQKEAQKQFARALKK